MSFDVELIEPNRYLEANLYGAVTTPNARSSLRALVLHPPTQFHGHAEKIEDRAEDQIEYVNEDKWVREKFESDLAMRGIKSLMPPEAYTDLTLEWNWSPFLKSVK